MAMILVFAGAASAATFINIGTGSTGGTYYPVGAGMAKVWNSAIPGMKANAQSTGGTAQNLALLGKGEAEVIFADGLYFFAYEGKGTFEGKPMKELRGLVPLYAEPIHFLVAKGSNIKSIKDLKGKRVSVGAVGSGTEVTVRTLLKVAGIDPDKDIRAENLDRQTQPEHLLTRTSTHLRRCARHRWELLASLTLGTAEFRDIPDDIVAKLGKELPTTCPLISRQTPTGLIRQSLLAPWQAERSHHHRKLGEEDAYKMTKALTSTSRISSTFPRGLLPCHPRTLSTSRSSFKGAEKYYARRYSK